MAGIKLEVRTQGGWHRFTATFPTQELAIAYAEARRSTHIVEELESAPLDWETQGKLLDYLYPKCHHGMDAQMCGDPYGPHHFGTVEWEREMGF